MHSMAQRPRLTEQNRSGSKRLCQEKVVCSGAKSVIQCKQCGTKQCKDCDTVLHKKSKFANHDRTHIEQPTFSNGAKACGMWCNPINSAEYSCIECKCLLCSECNRDFHKGRLTRHHRKPIPKPEVCIDIESDDQFLTAGGLALLSPDEKEFSISGTVGTSYRHRTQSADHHQSPPPAPSDSPPLFDDFQSIPVPITGPTAGLPQLGSPPAFEVLRESSSGYLRCIGSESVSPTSTNTGDYFSITGAYRSFEFDKDSQSANQVEPELEDIDRFNSQEAEALAFESGHFSSSNLDNTFFQESVSEHTSGTVLRNRKESTLPVVSSASLRESAYPSPLLATPVTSSGISTLKDPKLPLNPPLSQTISRQPVMAHLQTETKRKPVAKIQGSPSQSLTISATEEEDVLLLDSLGSDNSARKFKKEAVVMATLHKEKVNADSHKATTKDLMKKKVLTDHAAGFLLVDEHEKLQVKTAQDIIKKLQCHEDAPVKVVSIFGNTGDGKSYTLNHTFYGGQEVFSTSPLQESCTIGIWAAKDSTNNIVTIDTEGLLGVSPNENQRTRLLLKVLAISDVVIYRTRADRLHRDLFQFLGDASKAYLAHFTPELKAASQRCQIPMASMGPAVIVFHETTHTLPLGQVLLQDSQGIRAMLVCPPPPSFGVSLTEASSNASTSDKLTHSRSTAKAADTLLQERFKEHAFSMDAFSCVQYVGTQTITPPTDFSKLKKAVKTTIENSSVRSPRPVSVIYQALKVLNEKFSGDIEKSVANTFPDEYFTCSVRCMSCKERCSKTMNHMKDDVQHSIDPSKRCQYQHQYDNRVFICKTCYERGEEVVVVPKASSAADSSWYGLVKYAWAGYVLECRNCGIIYRSRQHWYGNLDPEITAVRTEIRHVMPGGQTVLQGTHNAARKLVDGISYVADTVSWVGAKPTKMVTQWMTDQIAPPYWKPNSLITNCHKCRKHFDTSEQIHHCRACGQGFCDDCSERTAPVPERGWGEDPVRVCDSCYEEKMQAGNLPAQQTAPEFDEEGKPVTARRVGEVVQTTFSVLGTAVQYPLGLMVDAARPAYWIPDSEIIKCCVCKMHFTLKLRKHHCRACGHGVCNDCSQHRRPVPSRGWDEQVRVCDTCNKKEESL